MNNIQPFEKDPQTKTETKKQPERHPHTANPPGNYGRSCGPEYDRRRKDPGPYSGH